MIEVKDLVYRYPKNRVNTMKDISFSISKGEIFGFLGPSGAGKSTTQKILIKLLSFLVSIVFHSLVTFLLYRFYCKRIV